MPILDYVQVGLSYLLSNVRGHDANLFFKLPAFSKFPEPTIAVECPEVGPSGSQLSVDHTQFGAGRFPTLKWPPASPETKEYLLIVEDADSPFGSIPTMHGLYYSIPATSTGVSDADFKPGSNGPYTLSGGFKYGKDRRSNIYIPPRPLMGHGPHRYFFELVALSAPIDGTKLSPLATKEEIAKDIEGKVAGWGFWEGSYEEKWE